MHDTQMSRAGSATSPGEKNTESINTKMPAEMLDFVVKRCVNLGIESPPEYVRYLIRNDKAKVRNDLMLLAETFNAKVSFGNSGPLDSGDAWQSP